MRREANVLAFNDVFRVVALVAFAYLAWCLLEIGQAKRAAARAARHARSLQDSASEVGTDAANPTPDDEDDAPAATMTSTAAQPPPATR